MEIKKVTLAGLGAIGCFFAPGLYGYLGNNFRVLADGGRKERLEKQGVEINGTRYHFPVIEPGTEGDPADLIIVSVKTTALENVISQLKNQIGEHTQIIAVQNGVDSEEKVAEVYGWDHLMYSLMRASSVMRGDICSYDAEAGKVYFGEKENDLHHLTERVQAVENLFKVSGIGYEIKEDMVHEIWNKYMANIGENMTCAVLGISFGEFRTNDEANWLREAAMREVQKVAAQKSIILTDEEIERQGKVVRTLRAENKPSTLQDLEQGRKTEIETFAGKMLRMGRELGVPTPINEVYYHAVKALELKGQK